jgi:hypothetical protein
LPHLCALVAELLAHLKDIPKTMTSLTKNVPREPVRTTDTDGAAIVLVPLANHPKPAKLLAEDFDMLRRAGVSSQWTFNPSGKDARYCYVRAQVGAWRNLAVVARLIMATGGNHKVRYADDDRLNLRRDNLCLANMVGRASGREHSFMLGHSVVAQGASI